MARNDRGNRQRRGWVPFVLILLAIYAINHLPLIVMAGLALVAVMVVASFLLPAFINAWGGTVDEHTVEQAKGWLSGADGFIHNLLFSQSGPPFSTPAPHTASTSAAENAMIRAGWTSDNHRLWCSDLGVLAYRGKKPHLYRESNIPTNVEHLRPFIVMEVPWGISSEEIAECNGVRFNLIDGTGRLRFTARQRFAFKPGENFLTPETWLRVDSQLEDLIDLDHNQFDSQWQLQVLAGQSMIAEHPFGWRHVAGANGSPLTADGEMSEDAQQWFDDNADESVSLADLMAEQSEGDQVARRVNRAGAR